jgi:hypothetical protein
VIPELLRILDANAGRKIVPDVEKLAMDEHAESWFTLWPTAGAACGDEWSVGAGCGIRQAF